MDETVASLMQRTVHTIGMDDTVPAIEALFAREHLSWAPVVTEAGDVVGVISKTDLLRHHARGPDAAPRAAWQLCSYKPITVAADAPLGDVARLMIAREIHHVVVKDAGRLTGVVSSLDFVRTFIRD